MTRLCFYLVLLGCLNASATINAQVKVNLKFEQVTLRDVIWELQKQTGFVFLYSTQDVEAVQLSGIEVKQKSVREVLEQCLYRSGLTYEVEDDVIVIRKDIIGKTICTHLKNQMCTNFVLHDQKFRSLRSPVVKKSIIIL